MREAEQAHRPGRSALAAVVLVVTLAALAACGGPSNGLSTSASVCFRGLPLAKEAVGSKGTLDGVREVKVSSLEKRIAQKLHSTSVTIPSGLVDEQGSELCAFAFKGSYKPGSVETATNTTTGKYAIVLVGIKHVELIAAVVLAKLPQRFSHPHVNLKP